MSNESDPVIGIDLGTTYSCVGYFRNGTVEIFANEMGNRTTPSYVAFTDTERLIGEAAKNQAASNPTNTIFDAKRLIGRKFSDPLVQKDMKLWPFKVVQGPNDKPLIEVEYKSETKQFTAEDVSAMILSKMKEIAESSLGCSVKKAVITVPAYFNDAQRQATKDAALIAGLNPLRIVNEPTAAALAYGLDKQNDETERNILIFDLGGGTFDVSLLCISGGVFEVKATNGDTHLGGEDFDNILVKFCMDDFKRKYKHDLSGNQRAIKRLKNVCEKGKRVLSASTTTDIEVDSLCDGKDYRLPLSRAKFEDLCSSFFEKTLRPVEQVLQDSKISKNQVDEVVLVGGSSRIPKVQEMLRNFFNGKKLCQQVNPDECVAYGAAVQGAVLSGNQDNVIKGLVLVDVCPLSLGIETSGGIMSAIISKNTSIPVKKTQSFSTYADNQSVVLVKVYEGERQFTKDNNLLGSFELTGIPPMPRGVPKIEITYDLDTNGILNVTALETSSKNKRSIKITNDRSRMSKEEIDRKIEEAKQFEEEDKKRVEQIQARQQVENFLYSTKNSSRDMKDKLPTDKYNRLETVVREGMEWLDQHPDENVETYKNKQQELEQVIHPIFNEAAGSSDENQKSESNSESNNDEPNQETNEEYVQRKVFEKEKKSNPFSKKDSNIDDLD